MENKYPNFSWPPLFLAVAKEQNWKGFFYKWKWGAVARSGKTRSPLPLTPRRRLHPSDRLSPILSSCLQAWSSLLSNPRIIVAQLYLVTSLKKVGRLTAAESCQIGLGDRYGWPTSPQSGQTPSSRSRGTSPANWQYVSTQFRHSLMDRRVREF